MPRSSATRAATVLIFSFLFTVPAHRASQSATAALSSASVTLGNAVVEVVAEPGDTVSVTLSRGDGGEQATSELATVPGIGRVNLELSDSSGTAVPVLSGDSLQILSGGQVLADATLPRLTTDADETTETVTGQASPNEQVTVRVTRFPAKQAEATVTASDDGAYQVNFAGSFDIMRMTEVTATVTDGPFEISAWWQLSDSISVTFFSNELSGKGPPGCWVRGHLERPGVGLLGSAEATRCDLIGSFGLTLLDAAGLPLLPSAGDIIHVEFLGMVAREYSVAQLSAEADPAADLVMGTAPPGAEVTVVLDLGLTQTSRTVNATPDGSYVADFAGDTDIEYGSAGVVTARTGSTTDTSLVWCLSRATVWLGEGNVEAIVAGVGPVTSLYLHGADGLLVAEATAAAIPTGPRGRRGLVTEILMQPDNRPAVVQPGQTLELKQGAHTASYRVPLLTVAADLEHDRVEGRALPHATVELLVGHTWGEASFEATADSEGRYSLDLSGRIDLTEGRKLRAEMSTDYGLHVIVASYTPRVLVWPDLAVATGSCAGEGQVSIALSNSTGQKRAEGTTTARADGGFEVDLLDQRGEPYRPSAGDKVRAQLAGTSIEYEVPRVTIEFDPETDTVAGTAPAEGNVAVRAQPPDGEGDETSQQTVLVGLDRRYGISFGGTHDLRPGSRVQVTFRAFGGSGVAFARVVPIVNIQVGGNEVHGFAPPFETVALQLTAAGHDLATAVAVTDSDQRFSVRLRSPTGSPARIEAGAEVAFGYGDELVTVPVGPLGIRVDIDGWSVAGSAPPNESLGIRRVTARVPEWRGTATSDASGMFTTELPDWDAPRRGEVFEVDYRSRDGHRLYAVGNSMQIAAYLATNKVLGLIGPYSRANVAVADRADQVIAELERTSDTRGVVTFTLGARKIVPGMRIHLQADGEEASMQVPHLVASVSRDCGRVKGIADSSIDAWPLEVLVYLQGDPEPRVVTATIGSSGRFLMDPSDRGGYPPLYSGDSVRLVEVLLSLPDGHRAVATAWPSTWLNIPFIRKR